MGETVEQRQSHPDGNSPDRVAALRAEIAHTRADLGQTVEALAAKADVKARARESLHDLSDRGREWVNRFGDAVRRRPVSIAAAVAAAALLLALVRWRRSR
jgi:hypothetical protein